MIPQKQHAFSLSNFEGPIDFLVHLIHREELNIYDISLSEITAQFLSKLEEWHEKSIEFGAEFIGTASYLLWLKSKTLLPSTESEEESSLNPDDDPHFDIIHHLLDYCRFKQAAKELSKRQDQQSDFFFRGFQDPSEPKKPLGINHISLDELSSLFKEMMLRAPQTLPCIYEETWRVSDKIRMVRQLLQNETQFNLDRLFMPQSPRLEWIVTFLALLELMKIGELGVGREVKSEMIVVFKK